MLKISFHFKFEYFNYEAKSNETNYIRLYLYRKTVGGGILFIKGHIYKT